MTQNETTSFPKITKIEMTSFGYWSLPESLDISYDKDFWSAEITKGSLTKRMSFEFDEIVFHLQAIVEWSSKPESVVSSAKRDHNEIAAMLDHTDNTVYFEFDGNTRRVLRLILMAEFKNDEVIKILESGNPETKGEYDATIEKLQKERQEYKRCRIRLLSEIQSIVKTDEFMLALKRSIDSYKEYLEYKEELNSLDWGISDEFSRSELCDPDLQENWDDDHRRRLSSNAGKSPFVIFRFIPPNAFFPVEGDNA